MTGLDPSLRMWADSGAMALTGRPDGPPLGPPAGLVDRLAAVSHPFDLDALALLGERAALAGLVRHGDVSCGGATRLLPAADGWLALTLSRPDDVDLVPALLGVNLLEGTEWGALARAARAGPADALVARARLVGLPAAVLALPPASDRVDLPVRRHRVAGPPAPARAIDALRVVDLSSLWAGPLCGSLLAAAGAQVVKVESTRRPDGARSGPTRFFDLLNGGKASVALDLTSREGASALATLIATADVVIEASRPRALRQMGIDACAALAAGGPSVWVSLTGHGRAAPGGDWVAFGDDAAVAGGLVAWDDRGPCFCADAVADPLSGLVAAAATRDALAGGGRWMIDVSMAGVAAWASGPTLPVPPEITAAPPRARTAVAPGPTLGEHTAAILAPLDQ